MGTRNLQQGGNEPIENQVNPSNKKPSFIRVILSFLKIGTIGFGGGAFTLIGLSVISSLF